MIEFVIDGRVLKQRMGISMGKECVSILVDLFLYSYKTYLKQGLLNKNERKIPRLIL